MAGVGKTGTSQSVPQYMDWNSFSIYSRNKEAVDKALQELGKRSSPQQESFKTSSTLAGQGAAVTAIAVAAIK